MNEPGVKADLGPSRTAAKEVDRAPFAHQLNRGLPGFRFAHRFDDHVGPRAQLGLARRHPVRLSRDVEHARRPQARRRFEPHPPTAGHDDLASLMTGQPGEHQADRARSDNQDRLPRPDLEILQSLHDTGQRLHQSGVVKPGLRLKPEQILLHQTMRNNNGLGIGAVQKEQVVAEVFLFVLAVEASPARGRVGHDDAITHRPARCRRVNLADDSREFMTEQGGRDDHLGVVAPLENFQIRPARQRGFDRHPDFAQFQGTFRNVLHSHQLFAVKNCRFHFENGSELEECLLGPLLNSKNVATQRAQGFAKNFIGETRTSLPSSGARLSSPKTRNMITETISHLAVKILDTAGYAGAGALMALESMIAPVPSEAVMPFVGFQVADGKWNLWLAILATSLGSIAGSMLSYWMGYYGGRPFVLKAGKYLFLNQRDLEWTEAFFQKRQGILTIFISRFIPVVRHFISIPAGTGKMPLAPFLAVTLLGATLWNTFLLICGMKLREHWTLVQKYSHQVDIGVVLVLLIAGLWFLQDRLRKSRLPR